MPAPAPPRARYCSPLLALAVGFLGVVACTGRQEPDPCASGPRIAALPLPASYAVEVGEEPVGVITVEGVESSGAPRLVAAPGAPAATVAEVDALLRELGAAPAITVSWSKESRGGDNYGCAIDVPRADPRYAAALERRLDGERLSAGFVRIHRADPEGD